MPIEQQEVGLSDFKLLDSGILSLTSFWLKHAMVNGRSLEIVCLRKRKSMTVLSFNRPFV